MTLEVGLTCNTYLIIELLNELIEGTGGDVPLLRARGVMPPKGIWYFMSEHRGIDFFMFILTSVLNGYKLSRNFGSVMIFGFIPSHKLALIKPCDLSLVLARELGLGMHSGAMVTVQPTEINFKRPHID